MWNQIILDYLTQLRDLLDDTLRRYQERGRQPCKHHACDTMEDLMVVHNRLNRAFERAIIDDAPPQGRDKQPA